MKQNSINNMMLGHLKDMKAKIEQKSILNMRLTFEGPFFKQVRGQIAGTHLMSVLLLCYG